MQLSIGEVVIGHTTPVRHHHLHTPTPQTEKVMTAHSKFYSSTQMKIGNKLTELGVGMENNKVKEVVIQESKLTPKIQEPLHPESTPQLRTDRPQVLGGGLRICHP